jgi:hypothetical protein
MSSASRRSSARQSLTGRAGRYRRQHGVAAVVDAHLNNLLGKQIGVNNLGTGTVNGTETSWGCAKGPGFPSCTSVSGSNVVSTPFLTHSPEPADEKQRSIDE